MKVRLFWVIMALIGISWVANFIYAQSQKLEQPVFLNHFIDVRTYDNQYVTFYYLTNKEDQSFIQVVELGDIRGLPERVGSNDGVREIDQFGRYSLREVTVQFSPEMSGTPTAPQRFTEMNVYFSEEKPTTYPIGQIVFHPWEEQVQPFTFVSTHAGIHMEERVRIAEPIMIESVNNSFENELRDHLFVKLQSAQDFASEQTAYEYGDKEWNEVKGTDARAVKFPVKLKTDDWLAIKSFIDPELHAVLDMAIGLKGKTDTGEPFTVPAGYMYYPHLDKQAVQTIIRERTGAGSNE
ncbi:hypothetical protein [Sporosarcina obsidiansis]|uniref:hypothetical protein n=1 Tax=Sporosarcina obsidiansis TaxID=2660748 RepID=UPI00129A7F5E|nr:hypothetical protein [Sporosarcina obsidiansis]